MKNETVFALLFVVACGETKYKNPPPIDSATAGDSGGSSSGGDPDPCVAYLGCRDAGGSAAQCASSTGADAEACDQRRCDELLDACEDGDAEACADLAACGDETTSGGDTTTGTESTGDTDLCSAYFGCLDACPTDAVCEDACAAATGVDIRACEDAQCERWIEDCAAGDAEACGHVPGCVESESSSSTSGSENGSSESSSSDTGTTGTTGTETSGTGTSESSGG
jgi:hypothetical protein